MFLINTDIKESAKSNSAINPMKKIKRDAASERGLQCIFEVAVKNCLSTGGKSFERDAN